MTTDYPKFPKLSPSEWTSTVQLVVNELEQAVSNWPSMNSAHEGLGLLDEEYEELRKIIHLKQKLRDLDQMRREAIQLAAVAIRFAFEVCNEEVGRR